MSRRIHAIVDRKVAADQVGTHGGVFTSEEIASIGGIRLVFTVVDPSHANIPSACAIALIVRLWPLAPSTEV